MCFNTIVICHGSYCELLQDSYYYLFVCNSIACVQCNLTCRVKVLAVHVGIIMGLLVCLSPTLWIMKDEVVFVLPVHKLCFSHPYGQPKGRFLGQTWTWQLLAAKEWVVPMKLQPSMRRTRNTFIYNMKIEWKGALFWISGQDWWFDYSLNLSNLDSPLYVTGHCFKRVWYIWSLVHLNNKTPLLM